MNAEAKARIPEFLDIIGARARLLATDIRNGKTWEGEVGRALSEMEATIKRAIEEAKQGGERC